MSTSPVLSFNCFLSIAQKRTAIEALLSAFGIHKRPARAAFFRRYALESLSTCDLIVLELPFQATLNETN